MDLYEHLIQAFNLTLAPKSGEDIKQAEQYLEKVIFYFLFNNCSFLRRKFSLNSLFP